MSDEPRPADTVPYIAHDEFRNGVAAGRWRIVVNPALARRYVVRRTRVDLLAVAVIGAGAVTALSGHAWTGLLMVAVGVVANRLVRYQAAKIVLQLATRDAAVYADVTTQGVMEVRRAA
jgi:hypothetical protein